MKHLIQLVIVATALLASCVVSATSVCEVPTTNLGRRAIVAVALPDGYCSDTLHRYPTVYLLNGHGGNHLSWPGMVNLDSLATVHNVIIVCPDGMNSWYFDSPVDPEMQMESYITRDLVGWVDSHYRTIDCPSKRAITGLSMGGHGALWIAFRHPDLFRNAGSTSGGVDFTPWTNRWNIPDALGAYADNQERWQKHTVMSLVPEVKPDTYNIIFDCGVDDFFFKVNNQLDSALTDRGIKHEYLTSPGGHTPSYWRKSLLPQLDFFSKQFNQRCPCSK